MVTLTILVTLYEISHLEFNKWIFYTKKINKYNDVKIVFVTNNPSFSKNWFEEISSLTTFIKVDDNIKKTRSILQSLKFFNSKWVKVMDPDDDIIFENLNEFLYQLRKINLSIPLVEAGYLSYCNDGHIENGNLGVGINYVAPNYSNLYNKKYLDQVPEPFESFTIWDDFFLAVSVCKNIWIKDVPFIMINLTKYYKYIGMSNVSNIISENVKPTRNFNANYFNLLEENINAFKSYKMVVDELIYDDLLHKNNRISFSQIKRANLFIVFSGINMYSRLKFSLKLMFVFKKRYLKVKHPFCFYITFLFKSTLRRRL